MGESKWKDPETPGSWMFSSTDLKPDFWHAENLHYSFHNGNNLQQTNYTQVMQKCSIHFCATLAASNPCTCRDLLIALANPKLDSRYKDQLKLHSDGKTKDLCSFEFEYEDRWVVTNNDLGTDIPCQGSLYEYCPKTCNGNDQLYFTSIYLRHKHLTTRGQFRH